MVRLSDDIGGPFIGQAHDVSGDGATVVGVRLDVNEAFRWENGRLTGLGVLAGTTHSRANAISIDGSAIVGSSGQEAFLWQAGVMTGLGVLPGHESSFARAVSRDGSVVVGNGISESGVFRHSSLFRARLLKWRDFER